MIERNLWLILVAMGSQGADIHLKCKNIRQKSIFFFVVIETDSEYFCDCSFLKKQQEYFVYTTPAFTNVGVNNIFAVLPDGKKGPLQP